MKTGKWTPSAEDLLTVVQGIDADGVDAGAHPVVNQDFVDKFHAVRKEFHVWVVDEPIGAKRFRELGVDSLITNRPGWLRQHFHP